MGLGQGLRRGRGGLGVVGIEVEGEGIVGGGSWVFFGVLVAKSAVYNDGLW